MQTLHHLYAPRDPKQNFVILIVGLLFIGSLLALCIWIK